jgi:putative protease
MEEEIGRVTHYFSHLHVAVLQLNQGLRMGETIHIRGHTTDFTERITSMEVDHRMVVHVDAGADVAIKVIEPVHPHDVVLRVIEQEAEAHAAC